MGTKAPAFNLVTKSLEEIQLSDYDGKRVILNIFPSLDTPVCAASVRRFNEEAVRLENTAVICVSMGTYLSRSRDSARQKASTNSKWLPLSARLCSRRTTGLRLSTVLLQGLLAREAVIVLDEKHDIIFSDLVEETTNEPDYKGALSVLK